jgi:amidase
VLLPTSIGTLRLPVTPMIGTIGTAPATGTLPSLEFSPQCCGNVDCPDITVGTTVFLPVSVDGALLSLGDLHAAMGDAEITGTALETSGEVLLRCEVRSREEAEYFATPYISTPESIGSIGCHFGETLDTNVKTAFGDMAERLHRSYGLSLTEAFEVLGMAALVRVHQCVDGGWTAASALLPRDALPGGARWTMHT